MEFFLFYCLSQRLYSSILTTNAAIRRQEVSIQKRSAKISPWKYRPFKIWISGFIFKLDYNFDHWSKIMQRMTEAAIFTICQSRIIGYGKIQPLVDYRTGPPRQPRISFEIVAASFLNYKSCLDQITDYEHQMKPFFIKVPSIWAWADNLGHLGYFWTIYQHPFWYCESLVHVFH